MKEKYDKRKMDKEEKAVRKTIRKDRGSVQNKNQKKYKYFCTKKSIRNYFLNRKPLKFDFQ